MTRTLQTIFCVLLMAYATACGGGGFVRPEYPMGVPATGTPANLQIRLQGGSEPLENLSGVYAGEKIYLEVSGLPPGTTVAWYTSDVSVGIFSAPGELSLRNPGNFEIRIHGGGSRKFIPVQVFASQPEASPAPSETPDPASTDPVPTPTPDPEPMATPDTDPTAAPVPEPSDSDPFMDEVVDFSPGPSGGFGAELLPQIVLGPPEGKGGFQGGNHVLSLGVGGSITLKSDTPILDGTGVDFIVFENAFWIGGNPEATFAEVGEVSVSQDGQTFVTFPCEADNEAELFPGCAGVTPVFANGQTNEIDPTDPETAGGDGFDLADLELPWVRYIRIRDLSHSGSGNTAGFDLDAIAIIYQ